MKLLAIHTSTDLCAVAILQQGVTYHQSMITPKTHADVLLSMLDEVINQADVGLQDIDGFIVTHGPGSFTGIRIGLSIMQAFSFVYNKPLVSISTLQFYAQSAFKQLKKEHVYVALDARMHAVYWGEYLQASESMKLVGSEKLLSVQQNNLDQVFPINSIAIGNGFKVYPELLSKIKMNQMDIDFVPKITDLFPLAIQRLKTQDEFSFALKRAQYFRETVT